MPCRLVACLVAVIGVLLIIVEQYLVPTIANSLIPVRSLSTCAAKHVLPAERHVVST